MGKYSIYNQDIMEFIKNYSGEPFHALLSDPPYNLDTIKKRFGKKDSAPAKFGTDGVFARSSRGFMGKTWDTDIAFQVETWEAIKSILYPGAFGLAFSSTRTYHRMATAIEDAGFVIHPMIGHIQSQGFPKATKLKDNNVFEGHRYGLQALKPSFEPICVFQKPYEGRPIDCINKTGAGTLNINASRIPLEGGEEYSINTFDDGMKPFGNGAGHKYTSRKVKKENLGRAIYQTQSWKNTSVAGVGSVNDAWKGGRWPANIVIDEDVDLWYDKFFYCAKANKNEKNAGLENYLTWENVDLSLELEELKELLKDISVDMIQEQINLEWNIILSGKNVMEKFQKDFLFTIRTVLKMIIELKTLNSFLSLSIKDYILDVIRMIEENGLNLVESVEFLKALQNTMKEKMEFPLNVSLVLLEELLKIREKGEKKGCFHPTVKPLDLCRWLANLLLTPEQYHGRLLVPFSGSCSEVIGGLQAEWDEVVGIDIEEKYCGIGIKRIEYWMKQENKE